MSAQNYSPRIGHQGQNVVVTKPVTTTVSVLSILAFIGLVAGVAWIMVKVMKKYPASNERRPLLENRSAVNAQY